MMKINGPQRLYLECFERFPSSIDFYDFSVVYDLAIELCEPRVTKIKAVCNLQKILDQNIKRTANSVLLRVIFRTVNFYRLYLGYDVPVIKITPFILSTLVPQT